MLASAAQVVTKEVVEVGAFGALGIPRKQWRQIGRRGVGGGESEERGK